MRILYIAHYKEFGGWSQAATDNILALDNVGVDVVCRNVTLTQDKQEVHPRILELEKKDLKILAGGALNHRNPKHDPIIAPQKIETSPVPSMYGICK